MTDQAGPIKRAVVNVTTTGSIIAAVASKRIAILGLSLSNTGASASKIAVMDQDANVIIDDHVLPVDSAPWVLPHSGISWNDSATANKAIHLRLSVGTTITGVVVYQEVT